jgi:hypothetical protein
MSFRLIRNNLGILSKRIVNLYNSSGSCGRYSDGFWRLHLQRKHCADRMGNYDTRTIDDLVIFCVFERSTRYTYSDSDNNNSYLQLFCRIHFRLLS